ncbi:MAG: tetratricopeptide repeat protein, partial [Candidatus Stahlbacteria bacterium]|nr:tetratricopeptide repeat protein [Candidatus Stahlbacteria bacterium]
MIGQIVDTRYKVIEKLGSGGMGECYKVIDQARNSTSLNLLAMKVSYLNEANLPSKRKSRLSVKKEFQTLAMLSHPNILKVYDFGITEDNRHYFTMEYVDGKDISELIHRPCTPKRYQLVYAILSQICDALQFIHSRDLVHGDIKPSNIIIDKFAPKLTDFGLVSVITKSNIHMLKGTIHYIAPELLVGRKIDKRADFFSLGVTIYQILTGSLPFKGRNPITLLNVYRKKGFLIAPRKLNPKIPKELNDLILKLLEIDPDKRVKSIDEIQEVIAKLSGKSRKQPIYNSQFIGREKELTMLIQEYKKVLGRKGRNVVIFGENGIGKTRLVQEIKIYAELKKAIVREINYHKETGLHLFADICCSAPVPTQNGSGAEILERSRNLGAEQKSWSGAEILEWSRNLGVEQKSWSGAEIPTRRDRPGGTDPAGPLRRGGIGCKGMGENQIVVFEKLLRLLANIARKRPIVLVVENIELADKVSLSFVKYLMRAIEQCRILLIVTTSDKSIIANITGRRGFHSPFSSEAEEVQPQKEHCLLERSGNPAPAGIELSPFTINQTILQIKSMLGTELDIKDIGDFIYQKTEGNPFLIEKLMQILIEEHCISKIEDKWQLDREKILPLQLPKDIEQFIELKVQKLDKKEMQVLEIAAILGENFEFQLLQGVLPQKVKKSKILPSILNVLIQKGLIVELQGQKYTFVHKIVAESIRTKIIPLRAHKIHRKAGKVLEGMSEPNFEPIAERIAHHYLIAGKREKAFRFAIIAAEKAKKEHSNAEAIRYFELALTVAYKKSKFTILETIGDLYLLIGEAEKARGIYERLLLFKPAKQIYRKIAKVYREQGNLNQALEFLIKGLKGVQNKNKQEKILLLADISAVYGQLHNYKKSKSYALKSIRRAKKENDKNNLMYAYNSIAVLYYHTADWDKAIKYYKRVFKIAKLLADTKYIVSASYSLGLTYWKKGDRQEAEKFYFKSIKITKKIGDVNRLMDNYTSFGILAQESSDNDKALKYHNKALNIAKKLDNLETIARSYINIGIVYKNIGDWEHSIQYYQKGLLIYKKRNQDNFVAVCYNNIGDLYRVKGDYIEAIANLKQALTITRKINDKERIGNICATLGEILCDKSEYKEAEKYLLESLKIYTIIGLKNTPVTRILAYMYLKMGNLLLAEEYCQKVISFAKKTEDKQELAHAYYIMGTIYSRCDKMVQAINSFNLGIKIFRTIGNKYELGKAILNAAEELFRTGSENPNFT